MLRRSLVSMSLMVVSFALVQGVLQSGRSEGHQPAAQYAELDVRTVIDEPARDLVLLVVEVSDGLKIKQGVDGPCADVVLGFIHLSTDTGAPGGDDERQPHVSHNRNQRDQRVGKAEKRPQNCADEQDFYHCGSNIERDKRQQKLDAVCASVNESIKCPGFAREVEADGQRVQVIEHLSCKRSNGMLGDPGKERIP